MSLGSERKLIENNADWEKSNASRLRNWYRLSLRIQTTGSGSIYERQPGVSVATAVMCPSYKTIVTIEAGRSLQG